MRNILFAAWLLIIPLASCSPSAASPTTVINSATQTPKIPHSSTYTSIPKPFMTITPAKNETPSRTASPQAFETLASPNGEFIANAYFETDHPSGMQTIEIINKEGNLIWQIPFQGELPTGYPRPLLVIFQWSNDSAQLYFYYVWSPDGGDRAFWWTGYDLQKIDVKTGDIQYVLPGQGFMSFAVSPDGEQIAYTRNQDQPSIIYIRHLFTGTERTAYVLGGSKNYVRVGDIHWSPSGNEVVFQTETEDYKVQTILLNPVTMKQKVIREYGLFTLFFDGWTEDGKLQFSEVSPNGVRIDNVFQIDVTTSEIFDVGTPTPRP
ncbi:MAG: TolB family protein [Chloroflexota bacterium]